METRFKVVTSAEISAEMVYVVGPFVTGPADMHEAAEARPLVLVGSDSQVPHL